jgi:cysteinyl-tRNA synthetase
MDFCKNHSPDEQWTISHEQYRPFVLYHRTQAAALAKLELYDDNSAELAIEEVNTGLSRLRQLFEAYEAEEQFEEDELIQRLVEFKDNLREKYEIGRTLHEQLQDAIADENYERAAEIRDEISKRENDTDFGRSEDFEGPTFDLS